MASKKNEKAESKKLNVEIAPANWTRMQQYLKDYNERPDRQTPVLKYTDIINEAILLYFKSSAKR